MKNCLSFIILLTALNMHVGLCQVNSPKAPECTIVQSGFVLNQPPFRQCHASTIVGLNDGSVMAAFFGGSYEGASDVCIWTTTLSEEGWSVPLKTADGTINDTIIYPCWNPVLFKSHHGVIYLFYKVGKNPREWFGMIKTSDDDGLTWSDPLKIPDGFLGPVKNKPVELSDGQLLCPSSTETVTEWKIRMEVFNPTLGTWKVGKIDQHNDFQLIQPTILSYGKSNYRILCRSKSDSVITSFSSDNGNSWGRFSAIDLPNPNSGIDGLTLPDGSHLLVYNPLISGKDWVNGRNQLNLAWSADGLTWNDILILEKEEEGEFSYPAIIQTSDNLIHITYTYNRTHIKYRQIRMGWNQQ